jgi:hypothetical protein
VAALAVAILMYAGLTRAQSPSPPAATPARDFVDAEDLQEAMPAATAFPRPSYFPGMVPMSSRVELGLFDTITESIFGQPDPDTCRPLSFGTLFSEGWNEAWCRRRTDRAARPGRARSY